MSNQVKYAAVMALLGLEIPSVDDARSLLAAWRKVPEMSDSDYEDIIQMWLQGRRCGFVVMGVADEEPAKEPESTPVNAT